MIKLLLQEFRCLSNATIHNRQKPLQFSCFKYRILEFKKNIITLIFHIQENHYSVFISFNPRISEFKTSIGFFKFKKLTESKKCEKRSHKAAEVKGAYSDGFTITVLPKT